MMESIRQDLRYALRQLRRVPGFTAVAVLTLALGIAANTTIFSAVNALLLESLPYPDRDRLVQFGQLRENGEEWSQLSAASYLALRDQSPEFESLAAFHWWGVNLGGEEGADRITGFQASPDFFATLGASPLLGRTFASGEGEPGRDRVVILSEDLWRSRFAADPATLGESVRLDGEAHTVIGVMPSRQTFPPHAELWVPREFRSDHGASLYVVGRLEPGVTAQQAEGRLSALLRRLAEDAPQIHSGTGILLHPFYSEQIEYLTTYLGILFAAVGFVLLIACANIANLMLVRASGRSREIAVRTAIGAGRGRIVRQLLTESMLLALLSGVLGTLFAFWSVEMLQQSIPADVAHFVSGWSELAVDGRVLGFTLAISLLAGVLFGLVPALGAYRADPVRALRDGARGSMGGRGGRLRRTLVVAEVALALVLLVGAGLMVRSFVGLLRADPGFRTVVADFTSPERLMSSLLGIFALIALLIAAIGIYGVMAHVVSQRTHEIGVRMALGAEPGRVRRLVMRQGMTLALIGVAIGLAAAFVITPLLASMLYGVNASDPATFLIVALLLAAVSLLAVWLPARRATRVDPLIALRAE